jgi:site-specific DNA-methyltransferase (adenine-specific)
MTPEEQSRSGMSTRPTAIESTQDAAGCSLPASPCSSLLDLRLADCMDVMREAPDNHWDLAIVDPPYGINADKMGLGKGVGTDTRTWTAKGWDNCPPNLEYFKELERVSVNQIVWGANYYEHIPPSSCWLIWDKIQEFSGATFEMARTSFDKPSKAFRMARCEAYVGIQKIHPTQKPVKLYDWILANYAKPGDRILDTHMGSGSIAIACHYAGHHLTACEIDPDYYAAAVERIDRETAQMDFFSTNKQDMISASSRGRRI